MKKNGVPATLMDFAEKGIFVSIHQFCQETGKDRASVDKKLRLGMLKPIAGHNGNPAYRLRDMIDLVFYRDDKGRVDIDRLDPFRRKAHYSAEIDKLRMLKESGQLIPVAEVEAEQARIAKVLTQFLDTLPDILERDCGTTAQELAKIEKRIDACREDLYNAVKGEPDGAEQAVSVEAPTGTGKGSIRRATNRASKSRRQPKRDDARAARGTRKDVAQAKRKTGRN